MSKDDDEVLRVPKWFLPAIAVALFAIAGTGVKTWAQGNSNESALLDHGQRLNDHDGKINALNAHMASVDQSLKDLAEQQRQDSAKLDRLLEMELARGAQK